MAEEAREGKGRLQLLEEVKKMNNRGCTAAREGHFDDAKKYYEAALSKLISDREKGQNQGLPEAEAAAVALTNLGHLSSKVKNVSKSIEYYKKALQVLYHMYGQQSKCENTQVAEVLNTIGTLYVKQQQKMEGVKANKGQEESRENYHREAEYHYSHALEIYKRAHGSHGKSFGMAQTLCNLGNLYFLADNMKDAESYYKRSLFMYSSANSLNKRVSNKVAEAMSSLLNNLGSLCRQRQDYEEAFDYFKQALSFEYMCYGGECKNASVATTLSNCGDIAAKCGKFEEAVRFYQRSLNTFPEKQSSRDSVAGVKIRLGTTHFQMNQIQAARAYYKEALQLYENNEKNYRSIQGADAWHCLGILERKVHKVPEAASCQEKALDALNEHLKWLEHCGKGPTQSTRRLKNSIKSELINLESCQSFYRFKNDVRSMKLSDNQSRFRLWPGTGRNKRM